MRDVYVVMSEVNGYKNLVDVYAYPDAAEKAAKEWEKEFARDKDYAYVLKVPLL